MGVTSRRGFKQFELIVFPWRSRLELYSRFSFIVFDWSFQGLVTQTISIGKSLPNRFIIARDDQINNLKKAFDSYPEGISPPPAPGTSWKIDVLFAESPPQKTGYIGGNFPLPLQDELEKHDPPTVSPR